MQGSLTSVQGLGGQEGMASEEIRLGASAFVGVSFSEIKRKAGSIIKLGLRSSKSEPSLEGRFLSPAEHIP